MNETDKSYLAGFIDGEGCLQVTLGGKSWQIRLNVYNTSLELLEEIKSIVGFGSIYCKKPVKSSWKTQYVLYWSGRTAIDVVTMVLPYLKLKKKQAELLLKWKYRKHDHENRILIWKKMKKLNMRGRVAETESGGQIKSVCDSPICKNDKLAESGGNDLTALRA